MKEYTIYDKKTGEKVASGNAYDCADILGINVREIYRAGRAGENEKYRIDCDASYAHHHRDITKTLYTVYDRNDTVLCTGTSQECASFLGFRSLNSFYSIVSKTDKGMLHKYKFVKGKYELDELEE